MQAEPESVSIVAAIPAAGVSRLVAELRQSVLMIAEHERYRVDGPRTTSSEELMRQLVDIRVSIDVLTHPGGLPLHGSQSDVSALQPEISRVDTAPTATPVGSGQSGPGLPLSPLELAGLRSQMSRIAGRMNELQQLRNELETLIGRCRLSLGSGVLQDLD